MIVVLIEEMRSYSDSDSDDDFDDELDIRVEIPDVRLLDLVSQRVLMVPVSESEENPLERVRDAAIKGFEAAPASFHMVDIGDTYCCYDDNKIAEGLSVSHLTVRRGVLFLTSPNTA